MTNNELQTLSICGTPERNNGYLKGKKVYLAGPMHVCSDDGVGWRNSISHYLRNRFGLRVGDPTKMTANGTGEVGTDKVLFKKLIKEGNFGELKKAFYPIVHKDLRCVDHADFLIVVYDPTIHMCGTIHEVIQAHQQRKPMFMYFNKEHQESLNPWFFTFFKEEWIFSSWLKMLEHLNEINNGNFDSSRWTMAEYPDVYDPKEIE